MQLSLFSVYEQTQPMPMKRLTLFVLLVTSFISMFGQSFHIRLDDSEEIIKHNSTFTITHTTNTLIQQHMYIHNLTDHDINITVSRNDSILPAGMESMFCLNVCYTPETTEATHMLAVGDSVFFTVDLYPYNLTGDALIEYTVVSEPEQDTINFFARFIVTSLSIEDPNNEGFNLYPNPAQNQLFISGASWLNYSSVQIVDAYGRLILLEDIGMNENTIDISHLQPGIYVLSLIDKKGKIHNTKLRFIKSSG
jgi:hypothetical protein